MNAKYDELQITQAPEAAASDVAAASEASDAAGASAASHASEVAGASAAADACAATELESLLRAPSLRAASPRATAAAAGAAVVLGRIVALGEGGLPSVEFPQSGGARAARVAVQLSSEALHAALQFGYPVVLMFENGDPGLPIIVGLVQETRAPRPQSGAGTESPVPESPVPESPVSENPVRESPAVIEACVDGKRIRIIGEDEIVLECGSASITLRRNGRVVVRGTYVETCSEGTNRIKGGQVRIN